MEPIVRTDNNSGNARNIENNTGNTRNNNVCHSAYLPPEYIIQKLVNNTQQKIRIEYQSKIVSFYI